MSEINLNKENFQDEVIKSDLPVLVDFWAPWCGPCRMIGPIISALAEKYEGTLKVGKVNVDDNGELAASFGVSSIPCLMIFKNGEVVNHRIGAAGQPLLEAFINESL